MIAQKREKERCRAGAWRYQNNERAVLLFCRVSVGAGILPGPCAKVAAGEAATRKTAGKNLEVESPVKRWCGEGEYRNVGMKCQDTEGEFQARAGAPLTERDLSGING